MPKKADARLEGRILNAAYDLWERGGESALTMRAVAKAASTTTPTVYQRFRDKHDLIELLRRHAVQDLVAALTPARSPEEVCSRFLDFAMAHRNLYPLLTADWAVRLSRDDPKPSFDLIKKHLADRLGGSPDQHAELALALAGLVHGTATMLLCDGVEEKVSRDLRRICVEACEALIEHAENAAREVPRRRSSGRT
jgi:AcrR family transcriptional regulator